MAINIGEIDELKFKLSLIYFRKNHLHDITCVGMKAKQGVSYEYFEYPDHDFDLDTIGNMEITDLQQLCQQLGIKKADSNLKADILINNVGISLKSKRGALPALINHTHRCGIQKVCDRIALNIEPLDNAISDYWIKRKASTIGEDVHINHDNSSFKNIKQTLVPLLKYFLFKGTPKADSPLPAVQVLEFEDPTKFATWRILAIDDVATEIVEKIVISLRSKAMPKTYKHTNAMSERDMSIKKWTEFMQDSYKGTLHVRG